MRAISAVVLGATLLFACGVVEYRSVQRDFERAVRLDNEVSVTSALVEPTVGYQEVYDTLTEDYINRKGPRGIGEPRLRPNAWTLRSVSAWRLKQYKEARDAAATGLKLKETVSGSRDAVVMEMIPGLVGEDEVIDQWIQRDQQFTPSEYEEQKQFLLRSWEDFEGVTVNAATPKSTQYYLHYQKWRLLHHWSSMIEEIVVPEGVDREAERVAMHDWVKEKLNLSGDQDMAWLAEQERGLIPASHPLRQLIDAQER